jgi:hypothetical protein
MMVANKVMQDRCSSTASTDWMTTSENVVDMIPVDTNFLLTPVTRRSSYDLLRDTT